MAGGLATEKVVRPAMPEQKLWLKVLAMAVQEAQGAAPYGGASSAQARRARRWLTRPNRGFLQVCELAGLTAHETCLIQQRAKEQWTTNGETK